MNCLCPNCHQPVDCNELFCPVCDHPTKYRFVIDDETQDLIDGYPRYGDFTDPT